MARRKKMSALAKKKANPKSRYWMKKADKAWSEVVRAVGKCLICGSTYNLNPHHLVRRTNYYLRHNCYNGICLCPTHHTFGSEIAAHGGTDVTMAFTKWLEENRPDIVEWIEEHKYTREGELDYEARYNELREMDTPVW